MTSTRRVEEAKTDAEEVEGTSVGRSSKGFALKEDEEMKQ